jgi:starch-binding outer membrane protein, SusD/RagB family
MKTIIKIIIIPALLFTFSSCKDFLDIRPSSTVVEQDYWNTKSDVESVVAACYRAMLEDDFMKRLIIWGELRSDNVIAGISLEDECIKILDANLLPSNSLCKWNSFYRVINYCNTVIAYAPEVQKKDPDFNESEYLAIKSEMLTLRSLCYFYLVRAYREVPLVLEATLSDEQNFTLAKSDEKTILDQIVKDLLEAETAAVRNYNNDRYNKGRITKNALRALLADVYLWDQNYTSCIKYCDLVIEDKIQEAAKDENFIYTGKYPLYPSETLNNSAYAYSQIFGSGNSFESVFELQFSQATAMNAMIPWYYGFDYGTGTTRVGRLSVSGTLNIYKTTDNRGKDFYGTALNGFLPIFKYAGTNRTVNQDNVSVYWYRSNSSTSNWIIYRLTEVMLMKSEALTELNTENDRRSAFSLVSAIYNRSNPNAGVDSLKFSDYNTLASMEDLVLKERQREFLFEGKRWFDLVRQAKRDGNNKRLLDQVVSKYTGDQASIINKLSTYDALFLPIYQDELKLNPALVQNPAYLTETSSTK